MPDRDLSGSRRPDVAMGPGPALHINGLRFGRQVPRHRAADPLRLASLVCCRMPRHVHFFARRVRDDPIVLGPDGEATIELHVLEAAEGFGGW